MKLKRSVRAVLSVVAISGAFWSPLTAQAALLNSVLIGDTINTIQDSDSERVLRQNATGGYDVITTGGFQVGDIIESILQFDTVNSTNFLNLIDANGGPLPNYYQLTAYSQLRISSIDLVTDTDGSGSTTLNDVLRLNFGASGSLGTGVMVELYERDAAGQPSYSATVDPATGIANVLGQTLIAEFGLKELDDFWNSLAINNIAVIAGAVAGSGQAAQGEFGLSVLTNPGGLPIAANGIVGVDGNMHDVVGDASIYAREARTNSGWLVSSNLNASFKTVPEPGTLVLAGLGLLGVAAARRKGFAKA